MERGFRSKTPSYQYDYDRASLVRQRSATPTILLPKDSPGQQARPGREARESDTESGYGR